MIDENWQHIIRDAQLVSGHMLSFEHSEYLCIILNENLNNTQGFSFYIHETMNEVNVEGYQRVKEIADCSLISAGLFPLRMERYGFSRSDLLSLGRYAYSNLSNKLVEDNGDIYESIALNINSLANTLSVISRMEKRLV